MNYIREVQRPPREIIQAALRKHRTIPLAAKALNVGARTLARWLHDDPSIALVGVDRAPPGNKTRNAGARAIAVAALVRGDSVTTAALEAGVSRATVNRWLREARSERD